MLGTDEPRISYMSGDPDPVIRLNVENDGDFTLSPFLVGDLGTWLAPLVFGGAGNNQWVDLTVDASVMFGSPPPQAEYVKAIDVWAEDAYIPGQEEPTTTTPKRVDITVEWIEAPLFTPDPDEVNFVPGSDWSFPAPINVNITSSRGTPFEAI